MIAEALKIVVLAADQATGLEFIRIARADGMEVTSIVSGEGTPPGLVGTTIVRDPRSVDDLTAAFAGADVIVSCLTPSSTDPAVLKNSMAAVLRAMKAAKVSRLVAVSDSGAYIDGDDPMTRTLIKPVLQLVMAKPFAD